LKEFEVFQGYINELGRRLIDGTLACFRMICFIACMVCGLGALDGSHLHGEAVNIVVRTFTGGGYLLCLIMMHRSLYLSGRLIFRLNYRKIGSR